MSMWALVNDDGKVEARVEDEGILRFEMASFMDREEFEEWCVMVRDLYDAAEFDDTIERLSTCES